MFSMLFFLLCSDPHRCVASGFEAAPRMAKRGPNASSPILGNKDAITRLSPRSQRIIAPVSKGGGEVQLSASSTLSYYLVWSPNMLARTAASFVGLLALRHLFGDHLVSFLDSTGSTAATQGSSTLIIQRFFGMVILPLLSSACCSVQLLINFMVGAGGCAGFNKHLGPLRPYFLGALLSSVVPRIVTSAVGSWTRLGTQVLLAFLPEIVHVWNTSPVINRVLRETRKKSNSASESGTFKAEVELTIPGMGCVACINKINSSLQKVSSVSDSQAWLEDQGGKAKIQYTAGSDDDAQEKALKFAEAVRGAGFDPCTVGKVEIES